MRGQFYIISATVIIVMVASLINTLRTANPDLFQPLAESASFPAYNLQRASSDIARMAHKAYATSGNGGIPEQMLANFTAESSLFAEKNGMSITWSYTIENLTKERISIRYNTTFHMGTTKMEDSFKITRIGKWRQRINMNAGKTTVRLNFSENRVTNCTLQLNVSFAGNQQPANITSEEYSNFTGWHFQLPVEVYAGQYNRTDALLEPIIDFTKQFILMYGYPQVFDTNSVRVVENNEIGGFLQEVPSQFIPIKEFHNQSNASGTVMWIMNGSTPAGTIRYYSILFDLAETSQKPPPAYPTDLSITDNLLSSCYIEVNNSKARYILHSGGCDDDSNAGGLRNAWIANGSGHDIIDANNNYGQYFNGSTESGPILTYNISEGTLARSISYQLAKFLVNITTYSSLPYYKMDITSLVPWVSTFSPVTEHHGGSMCEYRNDSTRKWAEVYSPFWNGEGYGIVGLNVSITELYNTSYSCSRIRNRVNNPQNWTIYTIFRTPKYTAEDLYLEKYQPLNITLKNPQQYSGYCTSADITFQANNGMYAVTYPNTAGPILNSASGSASPIAILPEEELSEIIIE